MNINLSENDKRKDYDKKYYEKKKLKAKSQERYEEDYDLDSEAEALAMEFFKTYEGQPVFIHSYMQYLNVLYYDWQKLPEVKITTTYIN